MRNGKEIAQHYLNTKILGAYETTEVIWQSDSKGILKRTFSDSFVYSDDTHYTIERDMDVDGKMFIVHSVFPKTAIPVDNGGQIHMSVVHLDVSNVNRPYLIW